MFAGKSEELIRRLTRASIAKRRVLAVKSGLDTRYSGEHVASHAGARWPCHTVASSQELRQLLAAQEQPVEVLGIDEAQFLDEGLLPLALSLAGQGVQVICAGLDQDSLCRPFGPMGALLACADQVSKLSAVCVVCGEDASLTQMLIEGEPAGWEQVPSIKVGGSESYQARCRRCYQLPEQPAPERLTHSAPSEARPADRALSPSEGERGQTLQQLSERARVPPLEPVGELQGSARPRLEELGVRFQEETEFEGPGPTQWATVQLADGSIYALVHHYAHPSGALELLTQLGERVPANECRLSCARADWRAAWSAG